MNIIYISEKWIEVDDGQRKTHILKLLNSTDVSDRDQRMQALRAILYICQGHYQSLCLRENSHSQILMYVAVNQTHKLIELYYHVYLLFKSYIVLFQVSVPSVIPMIPS